MITLLIVLTLFFAAVCVGLSWYFRFKHYGNERLDDEEGNANSRSPHAPQVPKQKSDRQITRNARPPQPTPCSELADQSDFKQATVPANDRLKKPTTQPTLSQSGVPTEVISAEAETKLRSYGPCENQLESGLSGSDLDEAKSIQQDNTPDHFASDVEVPISGQQSTTPSFDLMDQLTGDQSAERVIDLDAMRPQLDEAVPISDSSQEEKTSRALSVVEDTPTSELAALEPTQEETSNRLEATIALADMAGQNITAIENEQIRGVPTYRPLVPPPATMPTRTRRSRTAAMPATNLDDLRLRLQLIFGRAGDVNLNLVADRREQMPDEVDVSLMQGTLRLVRHQKDCYEPVRLSKASTALQDGVEWRGRSNSTYFRWMLSRRELHVLSEGDVSGLYHFGSAARLQLNAQHVVMAAFSLRDDVLAALSDVGCTPDIYDETTPGVPAGWLLFRNVIPTNAVPMRDGADILNALCPLPNVEPHFVGGIHLERSTWLLGYPPRIRLTGDLSSVEIKLDGRPIIIGEDGTLTAEGWDAHGVHRLWFGGQTQNYTLRTIDEHWQRWPAYDFGIGATICGASIDSNQSNRRSYQVVVPATNPLLIGATPGEVYYCHRRNNLRLQEYLTCVPFQPVWALPLDPAHAKRDSARILMLNAIEPAISANRRKLRQSGNREIEPWVSILNSASKKRLRIEPDNAESATLWQCYRLAAKQLRRNLR